ncbi:MAG: TonB-dependent receptor [Burkholderiaceae bacterium]
MTPPPFRRHPLTLALQAAALGALFGLGGHAAAQTTPAPAEPEPQPEAGEVQTVEVTGTRASLQRSINLKRNAATVQDSITALELGRFPDDNVADSLGHITGVAIKRGAGGEGRTVSVRGLGPEYTMTTFNGRILGTDGAGRDFAFDVLPSDVISGADVVKGAQASLSEGAIGGLVNLRSASPFEQRGQHGLVRLEADRNLMSELNGSKLSAAYSNTFDNHLGVLFGLVVAHRKERTDTAGNDGGWTRNPVPSDPSWPWGNAWGGNIDPNGNGVLDPEEEGLIGPGQFRVGSVLTDKKRLALSGKLEWRPSQDFKLVVDGIQTRLDAPEIGYQQSYYPLFAPGRWSNMVVSNGIVTDLTLDNTDPELRLNPELLNMTSHRVVDTALYGVNAEWKPTPDLTLTGDLYRSTSSRHSGGLDTYVVLRMNQPNVTRIRLTGEPVPEVVTTFADGRDLATGLASGQFGASDFNTHYMSLAGDNVDDKITGASLNGEWALDRYGVDLLHFGVAATDRRKARDLVNNSLTGGADYYSGSNAINVADLGGNVISHSFTLPNFMSGAHSNFPKSFLAFDVPGYLQQLKAYDGHARPDGGVYSFADAAPVWNPLQSYRVTERTVATWLQADLSGDKWNADVGVRLVNTRTTAQAWDAKILGITENGPFNYTAEYAPPTEIQQEGNYTFALPSANFVWHFDSQLQLRVGAAKTMARPPVDKLAPTNTTESISWGEFTQVFGGNVDLKPYSAVQGDVSLEWYYAKNSIFNVAVFQKDIKNQITTSWETGQDIGVPGYLFNIIRPINGDHARVQGYEVGLQHLWDNGFGVRAQYTHNDAVSWVGGERRPLEGIAPATSSLGFLYEKGDWSLSVDADHTSGFTTAVNVLGNGYNEQVKPITWMSANVSYSISDQWRLTFEGRNLLDATERYTLGGNSLLPQGYNRYGRAFTIGASYKF